MSTGIRAGPLAVGAASSGRIASGPPRRQPDQAPLGQPDLVVQQVREHPGGDDAERTDDEGSVERAGVPVADPHRERSLAGGLVGRDVPDVVRLQDRHGEQTHGGRAPPRRRGHRLDHHERRPARCDQPEEHENRHLAQTEARVRTGSTAVQERGQDREPADHEDQHGLGRRGQREPGEPRDRDRGQCCEENRSGTRRSALGQSRRADPLARIDPARAVEVVVREVDTHLEAGRDQQGGSEAPPDDVAGGRRSDQHGDEARAERPRPSPEPPHPPTGRGGHGRFGNLEKSGSRFWVNASRPSCASGVM
jgi:hypothetical protein